VVGPLARQEARPEQAGKTRREEANTGARRMIEYTVKVYESGTKCWYLNGKLHREDGPACEYANGDKFWLLDGKCHREDGPAREYADGDKSWWLNGKRHREDGPAIEYASGDKVWYLNGKCHREDGPAREYANGTKFWYLNGEPVTEEEHKQRTSPTKELTVQEISELLGYEVKVVK